ncbi:MAG: hypothetical protein N2C12_04090, partial [Planctomycetales bacterium]
MNFALFGIDRFTEQLARQIQSSSDHELIWYCQVPTPAAPELPGTLELGVDQVTRFEQDWHGSLCLCDADAVIVSFWQDADRLVDSVRQMNQIQIPLVLSHPLSFTPLTYYEMELIATDSTTMLVPFLPASWHPAVAQLSQDGSGHWGTIQQVEFERTIRHGRRPDALSEFARDVDLIRRFTGNLTEVSAMGGAHPEDYLPITVQMTGPHGILSRWSGALADGEP